MAGLPGAPSVMAQTQVTHDGVSTVECSASQTLPQFWRFLETTVVGPGRLGFWWQANARQALTAQVLEWVEEGLARWLVDQDLWVHESLDLAAGTNTIVWSCSGTRLGTTASRVSGWVDEVNLEPGWFWPTSRSKTPPATFSKPATPTARPNRIRGT